MPKYEQRQALEQYVRDYVAGGLRLFWQRHAMYFGAFVLAVSYYGELIGIVSYLMVLITEAFDHFLARRIERWKDHDLARAKKYYHLILVGTILNAASIAFYVIASSWAEGTDPHFTPLLFLFAAALFAAMNTHQIVVALAIRLSIYAAAFLAISLQNILVTDAPISSIHWLHFFTVLFVMYFIVDCSFVFLKMYRRNLKQMEHLRREHASAVEAYRAKSEFLSVVSHELRTPITSIKGSLNLAFSGKIGSLPPNMVHMLGIANRNANHLAMLIDDLLDFQAIEAGKLGMIFNEIDLCKFVHDSMEATSGYLKDRKVDVKYVGPAPTIKVSGDTRRLMQVMANVLSNAIKFSKEHGSVEVGIERIGSIACISVRDFGKGIPPNHEDQVFAAFSQIDSADRRSVNGTGLGMCVSKRIMLEHDGDISYESEQGLGTVFKITLPVIEDQDELVRPAERQAATLLPSIFAQPSEMSAGF